MSVKIIMFTQASKKKCLLDSDGLGETLIVSDGPSIREDLFRTNAWELSVSFEHWEELGGSRTDIGGQFLDSWVFLDHCFA
jgi:hypothetical protein